VYKAAPLLVKNQATDFVQMVQELIPEKSALKRKNSHFQAGKGWTIEATRKTWFQASRATIYLARKGSVTNENVLLLFVTEPINRTPCYVLLLVSVLFGAIKLEQHCLRKGLSGLVLLHILPLALH
jgi:hypothetical protein